MVFTGVNAPYDRWLEKVLARPGVVRAFDIANVHVRGGVGKLDDMVRVARARYRAHGFRGPIWVTEMDTRAIAISNGTPFTSVATSAQPSTSRRATCARQSRCY